MTAVAWFDSSTAAEQKCLELVDENVLTRTLKHEFFGLRLAHAGQPSPSSPPPIRLRAVAAATALHHSVAIRSMKLEAEGAAPPNNRDLEVHDRDVRRSEHKVALFLDACVPDPGPCSPADHRGRLCAQQYRKIQQMNTWVDQRAAAGADGVKFPALLHSRRPSMAYRRIQGDRLTEGPATNVDYERGYATEESIVQAHPELVHPRLARQ